ncbi:hypothetical protein FBEOM_294 [Fusarium beomiforme]|uniref:Uncharacterized protein n=1 Tax=Fusarium beomiforme TaxID=44412 RepID=A0A9P5AWJ2_9HYPO|nr:hypothetical protein FBEOM_294 [Fusarium beomiforme]
MKYISTLFLISLLNGALAEGSDLASSCILTKMLPTITTGCFENPTGTAAASFASGSDASNTQPLSQPVHISSGTGSEAAEAHQATASAPESGPATNSRPILNGQSGSNATNQAPGSSSSPAIVSAASNIIGHVTVDMLIGALLGFSVPIFIHVL